MKKQQQFKRQFNKSVQLIAEAKPSTVFSCASSLSGCPIAKKAKVYLPLQIFQNCLFLAEQINDEWIAYLKGFERPEEAFEYEVTEMYFPKQKVSSTTCEAEDREIQEGTIGAIHSHVNMKAQFSSVDEAHMNHPIELVINNRGELAANGRTILECGRAHRGPAEIIFTGCGKELSLLEELRSKSTKDLTKFVTLNTQL